MSPQSPFKTPALVLSLRDYRESSLLVSLLCREGGRINALAKGARRPKSSLSPLLHSFSLLEVRLRPPRTGGLHNLEGADLLRQWRGLEKPEGLARSAYAGLAVEILETGEENDPHGEDLFEGGHHFLEGLESCLYPGSFALAAGMGLLRILGYGPDFSAFFERGLKEPWLLDLVEGRLEPPGRPPSHAALALPEKAVSEWMRLEQAGATIPFAEPAPVNRKMGRLLMDALLRLIEAQLERPLKSRRFLEEMILG